VAHERTLAELNAAGGKIVFLTQLREQTCESEQLQAEEYEAALEVDLLRSTLASLAPRAAEALRLRLAWHSKVGARKAGEALNAPNMLELDAALSEAQRAADAAERVRREEGVLRSKHAKLQGKLHALTALRPLIIANAGGVDGDGSVRVEAERVLSAARLTHLRLSIKAADLRLLMMRHEKAEANLHAAGGAIVCLKRLRLSLRGQGSATGASLPSAAPHGSAEASSAAARTGPLDEDGKLIPEVRNFVRGCFGPMLNAAMQGLLQRRPDDPYAFLTEWFWQRSDANRYEAREESCTPGDVAERRKKVVLLKGDLELLKRSIVALMSDPAEQVLGGSAMLVGMLSGLPQREVIFNALSDLGTGNAVSSAWSVEHGQAQISHGNNRILDALAEVLEHFPRTLLQVHVIPPVAVRLPKHLLAALRVGRPVNGATPASANDEPNADCMVVREPDYETVVRHGCARLARWRAEAVKHALVAKGIHPHRVVATAPNFDLGLQATGQLTLHELPATLCDAGDERTEARLPAGLVHSDDDAALADLRTRREERLQAAIEELSGLHALAAQTPGLALAAPVTIVVTVIELSVPAAEFASVCIAFGAERCDGLVAAFEVRDLAVDELEVELWEGELNAPRVRLLGGCTVAVGDVLAGTQRAVSGAALPVSDSSGRVLGMARVLVEDARFRAGSG
jgi:hypothetical protein